MIYFCLVLPCVSHALAYVGMFVCVLPATIRLPSPRALAASPAPYGKSRVRPGDSARVTASLRTMFPLKDVAPHRDGGFHTGTRHDRVEGRWAGEVTGADHWQLCWFFGLEQITEGLLECLYSLWGAHSRKEVRNVPRHVFSPKVWCAWLVAGTSLPPRGCLYTLKWCALPMLWFIHNIGHT